MSACVVLMLGPALAAAPEASGWGLPQLMAALAGVKEAQGRFVERRYLAMTDQPLVSEGTLSYRAPDSLEKKTLEPQPEDLRAEGGTLVIDRGGHRRSVALDAEPQIGALVESIRATLAGDLTTLNRFFLVAVAGGPVDWRLELRPRDLQLRRLLRSIVLAGSGTAIHTVDTTERDGDRSVLSIVAPAPGGRGPAGGSP